MLATLVAESAPRKFATRKACSNRGVRELDFHVEAAQVSVKFVVIVTLCSLWQS